MTAGFTINGRFLAQPVTGVQRYAREICLAMDDLLVRVNGRATMLVPPQVGAVPPLGAITVSPCGAFGGHAWEQIVLPARARHPLLNLCNTAPVLPGGQVVCLHDANVYTAPDSYSRSFRLFYKMLHPLLAQRAAQLTTVSKASRDQLAKHLPVGSRTIEVMPNGHEHAFRWQASASRLGQVMAGHRPFVLLLGSRARHKNAELVLRQAEALAALGLGLVVAGGSAEIFANLPALRQDHVTWLGAVSDDDLAWLYGQALCLAFPSRTEGFGLPIVEAMALGCPVVSSNTASMPEVCGSAALLASPDDPDAWHAHFEVLMRSPELREDLAARGRIQVRNFSWARSARDYLALFGHGA